MHAINADTIRKSTPTTDWEKNLLAHRGLAFQSDDLPSYPHSLTTAGKTERVCMCMCKHVRMHAFMKWLHAFLIPRQRVKIHQALPDDTCTQSIFLMHYKVQWVRVHQRMALYKVIYCYYYKHLFIMIKNFTNLQTTFSQKCDVFICSSISWQWLNEWCSVCQPLFPPPPTPFPQSKVHIHYLQIGTC